MKKLIILVKKEIADEKAEQELIEKKKNIKEMIGLIEAKQSLIKDFESKINIEKEEIKKLEANLEKGDFSILENPTCLDMLKNIPITFTTTSGN